MKGLLGLFLFTGFLQFAQAVVPVVKVDGSSTVFPIAEAVAEEFQNEKRGQVRVTVGISGTGGGFKKFCRGETDIQNASRPIQVEELANCKKASIRFFEIPIAYDATVVVVNPKNDWLQNISIEDLKKMWEPGAQGKIMTWDQVNAAWPKEKLKLYGAGSDSGTFDYFTEAIVGKAKSSRGDYSASENDNTLVTGISGDKFSLGYLPLAYYEENKSKLKVVGVINPNLKKPVSPSRATVESGDYAPLSRPVFIYVSETAMKKPEVREFVEFTNKNLAKIVPMVKYVPLPEKIYEISREHIKKNKLGTSFGGHSSMGLKMDQLMNREKKL